MSDGLSLRSLLPGAVQSGKKKKQPRKELTPFARFLRAVAGFILRRIADIVLIALLLVGFFLFRSNYYKANPVFLVNPADIEICGNVTIPREMLLTTFGWTKPVNGFDIVNSDAVSKLKTQMPLIKNVQMSYRPGGKLELWVEERMPLARLAGQRLPFVVDDEGVIFVYPRSRDGYPEISGFDLPETLEPAMRLSPSLNCMLHLIAAATEPETRLPSSIRRVTLLGPDVDDGLLILLADGRRVRIAWEDMATETVYSEGMLRRLRQVATVLSNPLLATKKDFNAMALDRVTVVDEEGL